MRWRKGEPSAPEPERPKGFDDFDLRLGDLMRGERATLGKSLLDVQRELKIKATYIAAIENADLSAFETQGFVAGYVRSYARYLGMDPEWAYAKFCGETEYEAPALAAAPAAFALRAKPQPRIRPRPADPLGDPNAAFVPRRESWISQIEPGALTSVVILMLLIGGIGYGGWTMLREVQRVQVAPIDQAPSVIAQIDPLGNVGGGAALRVAEPEAEPAGPGAAPSLEAMGRLYRPETLDTPVLVPRDGPIAAIDPGLARPLAGTAEAAAVEDADLAPVQVTRAAPPPVEIFAVRPSWVRVQAADGTVLFEKILDPGERYTVPQGDAPARLRAGNSGSLYFAVNGETYGPAAPGAQVVRNVALSPEALKEKYALADLTRDSDLARIVALAEAEAVVSD
ncbi:MAG: helix-turn-helix domain-containing protein [Gemmobacter sp.]